MNKAIKSPGGITVRLIEVLNGFKTKYRHWPTTLEAEAETIAFLATTSLTPLGFFLLQSKVNLVTGAASPSPQTYGPNRFNGGDKYV